MLRWHICMSYKTYCIRTHTYLQSCTPCARILTKKTNRLFSHRLPKLAYCSGLFFASRLICPLPVAMVFFYWWWTIVSVQTQLLALHYRCCAAMLLDSNYSCDLCRTQDLTNIRSMKPPPDKLMSSEGIMHYSPRPRPKWSEVPTEPCFPSFLSVPSSF